MQTHTHMLGHSDLPCFTLLSRGISHWSFLSWDYHCLLIHTHIYTHKHSLLSRYHLRPSSNLLFINCHDIFIFYCNVWMFCMWLSDNSLYKGTSQCWISRFLFVRFSFEFGVFFFFKRIYCSYCIFIHNPCHFYIFCPNCVTSGTSIKHTQFALFSNPKYVSMVLYCCNAFFSKTKYQLYCLRKVWHPHPHTHSLSWLNEFFPSWLFDSSYTVAFSMCCVIHFKSKIPQWPKLYIEPCVQASFLCVCTVVALFRMFFFFFFFYRPTMSSWELLAYCFSCQSSSSIIYIYTVVACLSN